MTTPLPSAAPDVAPPAPPRRAFGIAALASGTAALVLALLPSVSSAVVLVGLTSVPLVLAAVGLGAAALARSERRAAPIVALLLGALALAATVASLASALIGLVARVDALHPRAADTTQPTPAIDRSPVGVITTDARSYEMRVESTARSVVVRTRDDALDIAVTTSEFSPYSARGSIRRAADGSAGIEIEGRPIGATAVTVTRCQVLVDGSVIAERSSTGERTVDCRAAG